jgi:hypothetical protein
MATSRQTTQPESELVAMGVDHRLADSNPLEKAVERSARTPDSKKTY